jgi:hypothetical protein
MSIPRFASFYKALADRASAASYVETLLRHEKERREFEEKHKKTLDSIYDRIEKCANNGGIRMFFQNDSPAEPLNAPEIQSYLVKKGFEFSYNTIEWWNIKEEDELK